MPKVKLDATFCLTACCRPGRKRSDYYDTGTTLTPTQRTVDLIMQCQAQRGILEFSFAEHEDGMYMFHAHQSEFTELGWVGHFDVRGPGA